MQKYLEVSNKLLTFALREPAKPLYNTSLRFFFILCNSYIADFILYYNPIRI